MIVVFVVTALTGSSLSARARKRALEAVTSRVQAQKLYQLSQAIRICDTERETMQPVPDQIVTTFGFREVVCHDSISNSTFASTGAGPHLLERVRSMDPSAQANADYQAERSALPLRIGSQVLGCIGFEGHLGPEPVRWSIAAYGMVAQLLYRRHPSLLSGLVLCATARNVLGSPAERGWPRWRCRRRPPPSGGTRSCSR